MRWSNGLIPSTVTLPEVGCKMPESILIVVDFPAPFFPIKPTISPSPTENVMSSTARLMVCSLENRFRTAENLPFFCTGILNSFFRWFTSILIISLYTFLYILHKKAFILAICAMIYKVITTPKHSIMGENCVILGTMHLCFRSEWDTDSSLWLLTSHV